MKFFFLLKDVHPALTFGLFVWFENTTEQQKKKVKQNLKDKKMIGLEIPSLKPLCYEKVRKI